MSLPATAISRPHRTAKSLPVWPLWFMLGLLLSGALVLRVLEAGFITPIVADRWRVALAAIADAAAFRELFAITFPPLLMSADLLAALLPATGWLPLPLLVNIIAGGALCAAWAKLFRQAGYGPATAGLAALLLLAQPPLQQAIASGQGIPLGVLGMTMLAPAAIRMRETGEVNAIAIVGAALALMLFSAVSGAYMVLALLPFLVLLTPQQLLARSPVGVLLVLLFPLLFALAGYLYINWVFGGSPLAFAQLANAGIRGAAVNLGAYPWLTGWGGGILTGAVAGAGMMILSCPLLVWTLLRSVGPGALVLRMLAGAVLTAIIIASQAQFLGHPAWLLPYLLPIALIAVARRRPGRLSTAGLLLLLLLGMPGGWLVQGLAAPAQLTDWVRALHGERVSTAAMEQDAQFGLTLRDHDDIAIDADASGLVIPARGGAYGLVMPSSDRLKADLLRGLLSTRYVAVQDPGSLRGRQDRIGLAMPHLWRDGPPGGRLVVSVGPWRLWEQTAIRERSSGAEGKS